jgi:hypothetical protein
MGMDVVGRSNPDAYFRNNVWHWRPLWDFCISVAPATCDGVNGDTNDGDGLDEEGALELAGILTDWLERGWVKQYEEEYNARLSQLPRQTCRLCEGSGIRTDEIGVSAGMPTRELEEYVAIVTGRTHGWCNGCSGEGNTVHFETNYPFTEENVVNFVAFLEECGGFYIY